MLHSHHEELHHLYSSPCIIRAIISRRVRWAGRVACMRHKKLETYFCLQRIKGRYHTEDIRVGGRIMLKCISCGVWMDCGQGPVGAGFCERR
jgi:hypothetical protein